MSGRQFTDDLAIIIEASFYGSHTILFTVYLHILATRNRTNKWLHIISMTIMFLLSTIHLAISIAIGARGILVEYREAVYYHDAPLSNWSRGIYVAANTSADAYFSLAFPGYDVIELAEAVDPPLLCDMDQKLKRFLGLCY
ncbi:hypothetical protein C8J56DRAFT_137240 [Mycena floridula]|nr:hypothetical protein C8J56DRAFT_137240 [Mycena floridula]